MKNCTYGILLFFSLIPSLGLFRVWPLPSALDAGLTTISCAMLFATMLLANRDTTFRFNAASQLFLGFIAVLSVSTVLNDFAFDASWRWYLVAFIISLVALSAVSELKFSCAQRFHESLCLFLWVGCFVYGVVSLTKYYGLLSQILPFVEPSAGRLAGIWAQPNLTTTTCWLGILAGATALTRKSQIVWFPISIFVFGWVLACAASRMSWLIGFGLLALIIVSRLPRYQQAESKKVAHSLVWAVFSVFVMLMIVPIINQPIIDALVSAGILERGASVSLADRDLFSQSARLAEFSKMLSVPEVFSWSHWLFGIGPGNYPSFSYQADMASSPNSLAPGTWLHSHNLFTMVFAEFGLLGLAILITFLVYLVKVVLQKPIGVPQFFSIGGIGILFIHSNLEFPLWHLWFLVLLCLLLTNLFDVKELRGDSRWLKPSVGLMGLFMLLALLLNVGYQYVRIADVALSSDRDRQDFQTLSLLANDSLMGPYSILRKYRDFAPEEDNLDWQLREVQRMKRWQPRDLVVLREFSLLVLKQDVDRACEVAGGIAYRYPHSGPIMVEHAFLSNRLPAQQITRIVSCIEAGLAPRGESIQSIQEKNRARMAN